MRLRSVLATTAALGLILAACGDDPSGTPDSTDPAVVEIADDDPLSPTVRPGRATWSTGYFQAALFAALLEELGYTVESPSLHEYPPEEAYVEMAAGTFDFWPNGWYSQHLTHHRVKLDDGSTVGEHVVVIGNQIQAAALEGLVITKSVADEYEISSLDQINGDIELVSLFDADGNGRAEVYGCEDEWTCDDVIDEMIELNGWTNLEHVKAGYDGLVATSIERVGRNEPVIQYTWSPSGYLAALVPGQTVYWLSIGDRTMVLDGSGPSGIDFSGAPPAPLGGDCSSDPCWLGWEVADIQVTAAKDFADANPVAAALFEVVKITVADIAAQNLRYAAGEDTEADLERHADEWIEGNRAQVDEWLELARAADEG